MTDGLPTVVDALLAPFVDPASRTFLPALGASAMVAWAFLALTRGTVGWRDVVSPASWKHPSTVLDLQLLLVRPLLGVLGAGLQFGGAAGLAFALVSMLDHVVRGPALPVPPAPALAVTYTVVLFVCWDASRYVLHRLLHEVPALWRFHQVHHSAEVLTPLTFHRVHPVESALYALRGLFVTGTLAGLAFWLWRGAAVEVTVFGVNAIGLLANAVTGNLRHSHVWMRFPTWLERWLMSPAQHQYHHGETSAQHRRNLGTWLAIWDRWAGTWTPSPVAPPGPVGLRPEDRDHDPHDLVSALVDPFRAATRDLIS